MATPQEYVPNLIVTAGFPCSGKSTIANHLEGNNGFVRFSSDEIREAVFRVGPTDYEDYRQNDPYFENEEKLVFDCLDILKYKGLFQKKDVVIDITGFFNYDRDRFFNTNIELPANKYLLRLNVTPEEITKRNIEKGRTNDVYTGWKASWEEPHGNGYEVLTFDNNTPEDLEFIIASLDERFSR